MSEAVMADEVTIELHPDWDAALVVIKDNTRKKFLVSSQVLTIASAYFKALFTSGFEEGTKTQSGSRPEISLQDDSTEAMEVILSILHYKFLDEWNTLSAKSLATIAVHSDKYCCTASLSPWVDRWLANFQHTIERRDVGYLLLATSALEEAPSFQRVSRLAVLSLPLNFNFNLWHADDTLAALPEEVTEYISRKMKQVSKRLYSLLQETVIALVQNQSDIGRMHSSRCCKCLLVYERHRALHCPQCLPRDGEEPGAGDFPVFCCSETRVAECTLILTKHALYPNEKAWRMCTISEIAQRFNMVHMTRTHKCDFDQHCPLKKRLRSLEEAVANTIDGVLGMKLGTMTADDSTTKSEAETSQG